MDRTCQACGKPLAGMSSRAKYCSATCRARVSKGLVTPLPSRPTSPLDEPALVTAVRAQLASANRESSALGLAALELAEALAGSSTQPGAKATLAKQLEATLASAVKGAKVTSNPLDMIREQRDRKRAHA